LARRLCFLITELDPGGAERALFRLATGLDRERYALRVGCLSGKGVVGEWLERAGIEVFRCGMGGIWDISALRRLRRELVSWQPDVLHCLLFHANLAGRIAGRMARVPYIISSVRVEEKRRSHLWLDRLTRGLMDLEVCVSESAQGFTRRHSHIPADKLAVVPNGVDLRDFDGIPVPPPEWRLPDDAPVIASVGRLDEQKDPLTLVEAFAGATRGTPEAILAIAGEGPLREIVAARAAHLGIGERLRLLGYLSDVRPLLARCAVFVLASRWEGMPNALLEAMACGKPALVTAVGGCREMVEDGMNGYLVPPERPDMLAVRLGELLADPGRLAVMGRAARRIIEERYTVQHMVAAWERIYDRAFAEIIGERGVSPRKS
jgi:glycosyltransferase involved in cell wall biosynthesis